MAIKKYSILLAAVLFAACSGIKVLQIETAHAAMKLSVKKFPVAVKD